MSDSDRNLKSLRVMIVSHPGAWQQVLRKAVEACSIVKVIDVVGGSLSAAQHAKEGRPDIIVIDSSIPLDDLIALVQNVKQESPGTRSIVLADTTQQRRKLVGAGADYAITSLDYETQLGDILNQLGSTMPDGVV